MADIRLVRPEAGTNQAVACAPDAKFVFDFPTDAATLSRNGDNLVMTFEDGATLTLTDFYKAYSSKNMPSFEVDGAQVAGADFFAAMNEPDLMPAAGPGGRGAAAGVGGARYHEYANMALYDGLDRLGGLDVGWPDGGYEPEIDGAAGRRGDDDQGGYLLAGTTDGIPSITPEGPGAELNPDPNDPDIPNIPVPDGTPGGPVGGSADPSTGRDVLTVYERGLRNSTEDPNAPTKAEGKMHVESPDGIYSLEVGGKVVYDENGFCDDVYIKTDEGTLHVTGFNSKTGELTYEYTLEKSSQEHAQDGAGAQFGHDIPVTVTDPDGDSASSTITVVVVDDTPTANPDNVTIEEGQSVSGNVLTGKASVTVKEQGRVPMGENRPTGAADEYGADEAGTFKGENGEDGPTVQWNVDSSIYEVHKDQDSGDITVKTQYGDVTLKPDGSYTFKADDTLPYGQNRTLSFDYTITDADGDESKAELNITIDGNSTPDITPDDRIDKHDPDPYPEHKHEGAIGVKADSIIVDEAAWAEAHNTNVLKGGAGHTTHSYTGQGGFNVDLHGEGGDITLQYGGESVTLHVDGNTVTVKDKNGNELAEGAGLTVNGVTVYDFNAQVDTDGKVHVTYQYTLDGDQTHQKQGAIDENDALDDKITVHVVDGHGEDSADGYIDVQVHDDGPTVTVTPGTEGTLSGTLDMNFGADGMAVMPEGWPNGNVNWDALTVEVDGKVYYGKPNGNNMAFHVPGGTITIGGEGQSAFDGGPYNYTFTPDLSSKDSLDFTFVVKDSDGDTDRQDVHLKWSTPTPKIEGLKSLATDDSYVDASGGQPAGTKANTTPGEQPGSDDNNGKASSATSGPQSFTVETNGQECTLEITGDTGTEHGKLTVTFNVDGTVKSWTWGDTEQTSWPGEGVTVYGQYGDLTITQNNGSFEYTYTQKKNVDHSHKEGETNNPDESKDAAESFGVTLKYGEGNASSFKSSIDVSIDDDEPIADDNLNFNRVESFTQPDIAEPGQSDTPDSQTDTPAAAYDDMENGEKVEHPNDHTGNVTLTGQVEGLNFGADGAKSVDIVIDGRTFHGEPNPDSTTGEWTWTETTAGASSGTPDITFDPETGEFRVTLPAEEVKEFTHKGAKGEAIDKDGKPIDDHTIDFTVTVTDGDGDTATATGQLHPPVADDDSFNADVDKHFDESVDFHVHVQTGNTLVHVNGKFTAKFEERLSGHVFSHVPKVEGNNDWTIRVKYGERDYGKATFNTETSQWEFQFEDGSELTLTYNPDKDDPEKGNYKFEFKPSSGNSAKTQDFTCKVFNQKGEETNYRDEDNVRWGDGAGAVDTHSSSGDGHWFTDTDEHHNLVEAKSYGNEHGLKETDHWTNEDYSVSNPDVPEENPKEDSDAFFGQFFTDGHGNALTKDQVLLGENVKHFDIDEYGGDSQALSDALEAAAKEAAENGYILHVYSSSGKNDLELQNNLHWDDANGLIVIVDCDMTLKTRDGGANGGNLYLNGFLYVEGELSVAKDLKVSGGLAVNGDLTYEGVLDAYWTAKGDDGSLGDIEDSLPGYTVDFNELLGNDVDEDSETPDVWDTDHKHTDGQGLHIVDGSITLDPESAKDWDLHVDYENGTVTVTPKTDNPQSHPKFHYTVEDDHGLRDDASVSVDVYKFIEGHGGTLDDPVEGTGIHDIVVSNSEGNPEEHYVPKDYNIGLVLDASTSMEPEVWGKIEPPFDTTDWEGLPSELTVTVDGQDHTFTKSSDPDDWHLYTDEDGNRLTLYQDEGTKQWSSFEFNPANKEGEHTGRSHIEFNFDNGHHAMGEGTWHDRREILKDALTNLLEDLSGYEGNINLYVGQFNADSKELWTGNKEKLKELLEDDDKLQKFLDDYTTYAGTHYDDALGGDELEKWLEDMEKNGNETHLYFLTDGKPNEGSETDPDEHKGKNEFKELEDQSVHVHAVGIGGDIDQDTLKDYDSDESPIIVPDDGDLEAALKAITDSFIEYIPTSDVVDAGGGDDIVFGDAVGDLYAKLDFLLGENASKEDSEKIPEEERNRLDDLRAKLSADDKRFWEQQVDKAGGWNAVLAAQFIAAHPDWFDQSYDYYYVKSSENDQDGTAYFYDKGDVLLGGNGDDILYGQGGNDILFGDGSLTGNGNDETNDYGTLGQLAQLLDSTAADKEDKGVSELIDKLNGQRNQPAEGNTDTGAASGLDKEKLSDLAEALEGKNGQGGIESESDGDDLLYGGNGDDLLLGGGGDDKLFGGAGEDYLFGGSGNDYLDGGKDKDYLYGGSGDDLIVYDSSDYAVFGGSGIDILLSNDEDKKDPSLDELLGNTVGSDKPHVEGVEVFLKGSGEYNGEKFDVEDLTSLSDLAKKAGITVKDDGTLTLGEGWHLQDGSDNIYTNDNGLTVELHGMTPAEQTGDSESQQLVFQLQNTQS